MGGGGLQLALAGVDLRPVAGKEERVLSSRSRYGKLRPNRLDFGVESASVGKWPFSFLARRLESPRKGVDSNIWR